MSASGYWSEDLSFILFLPHRQHTDTHKGFMVSETFYLFQVAKGGGGIFFLSEMHYMALERAEALTSFVFPPYLGLKEKGPEPSSLTDYKKIEDFSIKWYVVQEKKNRKKKQTL